MTKNELHRRISYWKSVLRLAGYGSLIWNLTYGVVLLIISEVLGIAEEVWGA